MADKGLKIDITADTSDFMKAIGSINQQIEQIGKFSAQPGSLITLLTGGIIGAGAIQGVREIFGAFRDAANEANELVDASDRLGISLQKLMSFRKQATLSGTNPDVAMAGLERLQFSMGQALRGSQTDIDSLRGVGITQEMLRSGKDAFEIWKQIADEAKKAGGSEVFKSRLRELGGESLRKSFPMMMESTPVEVSQAVVEVTLQMNKSGKQWATLTELLKSAGAVVYDFFSRPRSFDPKTGQFVLDERKPQSSVTRQERIEANLDVDARMAETKSKLLDEMERELKFQKMTPREQEAEIRRRRADIMQQMLDQESDLEGKVINPLKFQELREKDLKLQQLQAGISPSTTLSLSPVDIYKPKVDALTAIGGSIAGMGAAVSIPTRQLEVMKQNLDELKLLNQQFNQSFGQ